MDAIKKLFVIAAFLLGIAPAFAQQTGLPEIPLTIKDQKITVEVAATDNTRMTGLMHRRIMPENRGMLFVFPRSMPLSFWMMNTFIPLSIAYIDDNGTRRATSVTLAARK